MGKSKLTDEQRESIRQARNLEGVPYYILAQEYGVSARTIERICEPEKYEKQKQSNLNSQKRNYHKIRESQKNTYSRYQLKLHKENDADLITKLEEQESVNGYIKVLIKKDIDTENQ